MNNKTTSRPNCTGTFFRKNKWLPVSLLLCWMAAPAMQGSALAADLYWDGADTTSSNGAPTGGTGTWDAATTNWTNDAAGTTNQAWVAGDNAFFGGTGGTVTLGADQPVGDITFTSNGYTLSNNVLIFANLVNSYTVATGHTAQITSTVGQSGGITTNALTKLGEGKLILSGSGKNYTGDTTISAGTLEIRNGPLRGNVINNAALIVSNFSGSSTFSTTISGTGSLTKIGGGSVVLSGANTYTGGTTLSAGTLSLSGGAALADTGAVTVNGGTLNILAHETIGSLAGTGGIVHLNTGGLTVDDDNSTHYSGVILGANALTKQGTGTLTLSGANSYTGATTISAGTLQIGNGGTTGTLGSGNVTNNSALIFNRSDALTYAGDISGTGTLTKLGTGNLNLTGANTYTGTTTIDAGTLRVNGSITSATTVNNGGTLGGSGTVGNVTVNAGGILAPGNSIGTLNVSGDVDFSGGGVYQVEVDTAGNSDKIIATGTATLTGGSVQVLPEAGTYNIGTDYTILTAGSIVGTFDSVSSSLAFLDPTLSYDATNVYLNLTRNNVAFGDVASTPNQRAVGNALTAINLAGASGEMQTLLNTANTLTSSGARQAYDSLSGVQHTNAQALLLGANRHFTSLLNARTGLLSANPGAAVRPQAAFTPVHLAYTGDLADLQLAGNGSTSGLMENNGSGFWLTPQGGIGSIDDTANATGADYTWYGLYGGADKWLDNQRLVGVALGASHADADPASGDINLKSLELALYGRWLDETRYLDGSISAGRQRSETTRHVSVGTLNRIASADYDAQSLGLALEAGQTTFSQDDWRVAPFAGLRYVRLSRDGFNETGAGSANLTVGSETQESLQGRIGVRAQQRTGADSGRRLDWDVSVAWAHELKDTTSTLNAGFEGAPNTVFGIDGPELDRNRVQLGAGLTIDIVSATTLRIGYDGELAGSDQNHAASASFQMKW